MLAISYTNQDTLSVAFSQTLQLVPLWKWGGGGGGGGRGQERKEMGGTNNHKHKQYRQNLRMYVQYAC